jgi:phage gp36-like protein
MAMTYATEADLDLRFGADEITRLANRNRDGVRDNGVIAAALADADFKINSIAGDRIADLLADPDTAAALKRIACHIARYYLYDDLPTDHIKNLFDDAVRTLKAIREGSEGIGRAAGLDSATRETHTDIQITSGGTRWGGGAY